MTAVAAATTTVHCPVALCRHENPHSAESCARCRTPLAGYARLRAHPAYLFNRGLAAAREARFATARDCFAAVVLWCPTDTDARNALALACLHLGDPAEARKQWTEVLRRRPDDPKATTWLTRYAGPADPGGPGRPGGPGEVSPCGAGTG